MAEENKTPIFNIDLLAFDTYILAVRTTDNKILMRLDSDGTLRTTGDMVYKDNLGYYDRENNRINDKPKDVE
jgi:hypothetical protein